MEEIKYIEPAALRDEMLRLRNEEKMDFLESLTGMDWGVPTEGDAPGTVRGLGIVYHLESTETHGERGFQRYYAFLSLFTMSMLGLVVATNIFQMYLFWELVGVSSYLLIGFYFTKAPAVAASKKAFIVTRFADLGFLIGILIYGFYVGTFDFVGPNTSAAVGGAKMIPLALGLMFIGGAGKSAMFPLHIWLPDAMEGPTPVSALIHVSCYHRKCCWNDSIGILYIGLHCGQFGYIRYYHSY